MFKSYMVFIARSCALVRLLLLLYFVLILVMLFDTLFVNVQVLDYLAIAVHELANISERRIERLVNPGRDQLRLS